MEPHLVVGFDAREHKGKGQPADFLSIGWSPLLFLVQVFPIVWGKGNSYYILNNTLNGLIENPCPLNQEHHPYKC